MRSVLHLRVNNRRLFAADEVIPAGTRTRKVKVRAEPKPPSLPPKKKRVVHKHASRARPTNEPEEYEVCCVCISSLCLTYQGKWLLHASCGELLLVRIFLCEFCQVHSLYFIDEG